MSTRAFAGAVALLLTTAPDAWAQLTADEVWSGWQEAYGDFGMALTATEERSGGTLILNDLTQRMELAGVVTEGNYGAITLVEQTDGSVRIEIPEEMAVTSITTVEGETIEQTFRITQQGFEAVVSETDGTRAYVMGAQSLGYEFDDITSGEAPQPIPLTAMLGAFETTYTIAETDDGMSINQDFSADRMTVSADATATDEPFAFSYVATDLTGTGAGTFAGSTDISETPSLSELGIDFDMTFAHAGSELSVDADTPEGPFSMSSTASGGEVFVGLTPDGLSETFSSTGTEATIQVPQFPLPVAISMDAFSAGFTMPVGVSEDTKPLGLDVILRELVVDEAIWSLFDPTGQLPRDPATLVLDLDGEAVMSADILGDPEALADGPPGELKSLTLGDLTLSFGGADLAASGDLDFPTPDVTQPVGTIDLALDGAFGLVDRFVALGFLPAEQAAFAKGMAGAVARPVGEDQLESTIEFTEGGGISANGLPLR
ncbi:MAG: DUF2125 domain-containing protein [Pseudomonadota bacterium]